MGSVSPMGLVWMTMIGTLATCVAYFTGMLWHSKLKRLLLRNRYAAKFSFVRKSRGGRNIHLKRFFRIARDVVSDIEAALEPPRCNQHARSFLPILSDVRRRGEVLISQQTHAHRVGSPEREQELEDLIQQLASLEMHLRALPKPNVTIEEVLLGKFE